MSARALRRLAAALAQRDKAIAHLVNMLHAADDLADHANLNVWDTEIDMARIFLKECFARAIEAKLKEKNGG